MNNKILAELAKPFHPSRITWKPGALNGKKDSALALAYADPRAYQNRLDEVCGLDWAVSYTPWGDRIICHLTINGITRSSTGEPDSDSERNENSGSVAEAMSFKRACAMFGLGRYLYSMPSMWVEYDATRRSFTDKAKVRLQGVIAQHYQRWLDGQPTELESDDDAAGDDGDGGKGESVSQETDTLDQLGKELYGDQWPTVRAHNIKRLAGEETAALTQQQVQTLINGLKKLKQQRQAA